MSFFSLLQPYRRWVLLALVCVFLSNILALSVPWGIKLIIDDVLRAGEARFLRTIVGLLLAVLFIRTALNFFQKYTSSVVGERIVGDLRRELYIRAQGLSLGSLQSVTPSQVLSRLTGDVDSIRYFLFGDALDFVYSIFGAAGIVVLLLWIHPQLALLSLLTLPLFLLVYLRFLPRLKERYELLRDGYGALASRVNEVLHGLATVRAFGGEERERRIFDQRQGAVLQVANKTHALNAAMWIGVEFVTSAVTLGVLWLGGEAVLAGRLSPGALVAFYSYLGMLFIPLIRMVAINGSYQEAAAALKRIGEVMTLPGELPVSGVPVVLAEPSGQVIFEEVSFRYAADRKVLDRMTFTVDPGETVGIVGPSGAGKTTLVGLLLRFFDPDSGRILVDGVDLRRLDLQRYRSRVAVVLQDEFLFNDSVADNIRYGVEQASPNEVIAAARMAGADDFIRGLPQGYETCVGERGALLSCGQRQRIAIARALLKDPAILILDEATAAVDALMENEIQRAIKARLKKRTVFIVAHRFSSIMETDKIMVLEEGRLSGMGTHEELLRQNVFYRDLYWEQFKEAECPRGTDSMHEVTD